MTALLTFMKKDLLEQIRSGKLLILLIVFTLFGIMNPAVAKMTPWLLEIMSESLEQSGMTITPVSVSAMDSWVQFFKNIPMALIVFALMQGGALSGEYKSGTLILSLTKGLERYKVVISKSCLLLGLWSVFYWLCFGITYLYNAYFWDNSIAKNLGFSAICWWIFGIFTISLMILSSTVTSSFSGVLLITGGFVFVSSILGALPKIKDYTPTLLTDGTSLIFDKLQPSDYLPCLGITLALTIICFGASFPVFNKKQL